MKSFRNKRKNVKSATELNELELTAIMNKLRFEMIAKETMKCEYCSVNWPGVGKKTLNLWKISESKNLKCHNKCESPSHGAKEALKKSAMNNVECVRESKRHQLCCLS